jgi:predicted alpha/beta hydrolase family esterase
VVLAMPRPVLILPGWQNSGPQHWQTLWERAHPEYVRVQQRDWDYPVCSEWVETLERTLAQLSSPPVLVAHSLGCITLAHWAVSSRAQRFRRPLQGALLVAPPDVELPGTTTDVTGFAPVPLDRLPFVSILVASTSDPYCAIARAEQFANAWGSRLVNAGACGHINTDAGFGSWPEGEHLLAELTGMEAIHPPTEAGG